MVSLRPLKVKAIPMSAHDDPWQSHGLDLYDPTLPHILEGSSGTPWGGLQQSHTEPPSAPIKGEKAAPGTDLPPQKGERLPGSNCNPERQTPR